MEFQIQPATLENLGDIQDLNHQLCIKENKEFDPTINRDYPIQEGGEAYFKERIEKEDCCALIAKVNDKVIAYLVGAIVEAEEFRNISRIAEVENMFTLEEYRGQGIGKKLLEKFLEWCKVKGADRVKVVASAQNRRAIEFYKREGFEDYNLALEKSL